MGGDRGLAVLARFARRLDEFCHRGAVSGMRRRRLIRVGALARSPVGNDPHDLIAFHIQHFGQGIDFLPRADPVGQIRRSASERLSMTAPDSPRLLDRAIAASFASGDRPTRSLRCAARVSSAWSKSGTSGAACEARNAGILGGGSQEVVHAKRRPARPDKTAHGQQHQRCCAIAHPP